MTTINTVLFDADGVFQRAPGDFLERLTRAVLGSDGGDGMALLNDIFDAERLALTGEVDFAHSIVPVLEKWKSSCEAQVLMQQWQDIEVDDSVLMLIGDLRRSGIVCAIASNQQSYRAAHMSERLGYANHFDHEFYSCRLGHAKPSEDYFRAILRHGGFDAGRTLFLDDREDNVAAAQAVGLHATHFVLTEVGKGAEPMRTVLRRHGIAI